MVDLATAASQNGACTYLCIYNKCCLYEGIYLVSQLLHDKRVKFSRFFWCSVQYWFSYDGKAYQNNQTSFSHVICLGILCTVYAPFLLHIRPCGIYCNCGKQNYLNINEEPFLNLWAIFAILFLTFLDLRHLMILDSSRWFHSFVGPMS
jgi:hypothetical protein